MDGTASRNNCHQSVCTRCSELDLDGFPTAKSDSKLLGSPLDWTPETCEICKFFLECLPPGHRDASSTLYLRPLDTFEGVTRRLIRISDGEDDGWMLVLKQYHPSKIEELKWFVVPKERMFPWKAPPPRIDYNLTHIWLRAPISQFDYALPHEAMRLTVIDCETRSLIQASGQFEYVTLSYVWGIPSVTRSESSVATELQPSSDLLPQLPQTIEDAIVVVKSLGLQFLWIDRYCIPQIDCGERAKQIQRMDQIYSNSTLTLIACAGRDPRYGLPGVSHDRITCPSIHLGLHGTFQLMPNALDITLSSWALRGWTYQEALLSKRRLYFTDRQLVFESPGFVQSEVTALSLAPFKPKSEYIYSPDSWAQNPANVYKCIKEYSSRSLTVTDDVLNAMFGIFAVFERKFRVRHLWGLPFTEGPLICPQPRLRSCPSFQTFPTFPESLRWRSWLQIVRREGFPSWSWTGWIGELHWPWEPEIGSRLEDATKDDMQVEVELVSGRILDWEQSQKDVDPSSDPISTYLHVDAYVTPIQFKIYTQHQMDISDFGLERNDGEHTHWQEPVLSREPALNPSDTMLAIHIAPSRYQNDDYIPNIPVELESLMIIRHMGDHWERATTIQAHPGRLSELKMIRKKIRLG